MVDTGVMNKSIGFRHRRAGHTNAARRTQLLKAFDRSGLSAAAFARQHDLHYTTFCGWRQRRDSAALSPAFVQVELPAPVPPVELVIEVGTQARMRICSAAQIELAACLLRHLHPAS